LKQLLDFLDKKDMQPWLVLLQIQSKKTLKQWLDFSDNQGLQLWSDFR